MKVFARFTALVFMVFGVLIVLIGVYIMVSGYFSQQAATPVVPSLIPDLSGLVILARVIAGGAVSLQGLFLAAIGQVLWLLAAIADKTELTSEYMYALVRRVNQPKP
jgi:hypothetical protein